MPGINEKAAPVPFFRDPRKILYAVTYGLIGALAIAQVGLVGQQLHNGGNDVTNYPTREYKYDLGLLLFSCIVSIIIALAHTQLGMLGNAFVAFVFAIFWGAGAGIIFQVSPFKSYTCGLPASSFSPNWAPFASQCSRIVAIEAIAWSEFGLFTLLMLGILIDTVEFRPRHNKTFYSNAV